MKYILIQNIFTNQFKGKVPKFSLYTPISMMSCIFCKMSSRFFLQWKFCLHSHEGGSLRGSFFGYHSPSQPKYLLYLVQFSSVTQSCPTLCNSVDCSTTGFPVLHYLLELAQTPVHWVGDAIQPSHRLSLPSPPAFNLPQHQSLLQWAGSSYQVVKVLGFSFSIV